MDLFIKYDDEYLNIYQITNIDTANKTIKMSNGNFYEFTEDSFRKFLCRLNTMGYGIFQSSDLYKG